MLVEVGGRHTFRLGQCVLPGVSGEPSSDAACVVTQAAVSVSRLGSGLRSRRDALVCLKQLTSVRVVVVFASFDGR